VLIKKTIFLIECTQQDLNRVPYSCKLVPVYLSVSLHTAGHVQERFFSVSREKKLQGFFSFVFFFADGIASS
jgi:hypothetical protein